MPRQNRVSPFGDLIALPERGTFLGNRGILHDSQGHIKRAWQVKRWLVCVLSFRGRQRTIMTPNRYTELFFLDEATALAAGHRPCAECRHGRFIDFCMAWKNAQPGFGLQRPTADEIDNRLHAERVTADRTKRTYIATLDDLPDGVFVTMPQRGKRAYLVRCGGLLEWTPQGYAECQPCPPGVEVTILTPPSTVATIRAGYAPTLHASADLRKAPSFHPRGE